MADETSIAWLCEHHPERVDRMFGYLNLERNGLETVRTAVEKGDRVGACDALIAYYRDRAKEQNRTIEPVRPGTGTHSASEQILNDTFTFQGVTGTAPRKADGTLDWTYTGPKDDREWAFFLNRHGHLGTLMHAYQRTGNPAYVARMDAHIREWVLSNPYPGEQTGDPRWRGLETKSRISQWARIFYALAEDEGLSPAARILILSSIPNHAHYTMHFHSRGGNWLAMQMCALADGALQWPEYRDAETWLNYAVRTLLPEMERQVYPDGPQKELSSHYHGASLFSFQRLADLLGRAGREVPADFTQGLERMWNYWACSMRPDGHGVLNNDSNLDYNRPRVQGAAERYGRPDWIYIATNGEKGQKPEGLPSVMFPWSGQLVMRSGWDADAHWGFFDVGPWGIGHQHNDKLHLSVAAHGRDILVDAGRLYYKGDKWRRFIRGTTAHNTLLIDGGLQNDDVREADAPLDEKTYTLTPAFDYARASFTAGYQDIDGVAVHTRAVIYVRGEFWVVVDRVETDRPRQVQALWHYHPDCTVAIDGTSVMSTDADLGNVRVSPADGSNWTVEIVKGQEKPTIQGWYSRQYNHKAPASCAIFTTEIKDTTTFAWVIVPAKDAVPSVRVEMTSVDADGADVRTVVGDSAPVTVRAPLADGTPSVDISR